MPSVEDYEKLGSFYLGKKYDLKERALIDEFINYDSKDLVTHALCVGMTGSGKTGLCISLLEEAIIDDIPVLCIDPKGDIGNLLLTFPHLSPAEFEPWIEASEETRQNKPLPQIAEETANRWRKGLESWNQPIDRIQRLRDKADITIYTPGSSIGVPLTVLKGFEVPPQQVLDDAEAYRELVASSASGLLALLGITADPLTSREHILISNILDRSWRAGTCLTIEELIRLIQSPPISKIGVIDLETFYPTAERIKLSMSLNNLLASPSFAGWLEGKPLNIKNLLYREDGRPRVAILSISHLNESERMFFVTILLSELLSWMRSQPGTSSLRAIFYMDEVYGYFPPSAVPPSKPPMLTLLKQARAFGLGIVLATQNPMDLDYKGLSNMGTWFLGRLQTERDKNRVLDGLEGASLQQGARFSRAEMDRNLSSLGNRVFIMNNVHDDGPTIFQTRWALSFLRGPLSRPQISSLMREKREDVSKSIQSSTTSFGKPLSSNGLATTARPVVPATIAERFVEMTVVPATNNKVIYRPAVMAESKIHFVRATSNVDYWEESEWLVSIDSPFPDSLWANAQLVAPKSLSFSNAPDESIPFAELPAELVSAKNYARWEKEFKEHLFQHRQVIVFTSKALGKTTRPGQSEVDARIELAHDAKVARDEAVEGIRKKLGDRLKTIQQRALAAEQRLQKEKEAANSKKIEGVLNVGTSILGALFGRKLGSRANVSKATSAVKSIGKATAQSANVARAEESLEAIQSSMLDLEQEAELAIAKVSRDFAPENLTLETIVIPLRKSDTQIKQIAIAWIPWQIDPNGIATPLVERNSFR